MKKTKPLYEGKAKILWETDSPGYMVQEFKNDATAFDGTKHEVIAGKGILNNRISSHLFSLLKDEGVRTHFIEKISDNEMVVERLQMLPVEVVVRNVAAGSLVRRLGIEAGTRFDPPIVEFYLKNDALHDPIITEDHIRVMGLATEEQVTRMKRDALDGQRRDEELPRAAEHGARRLQAGVRDEGRRGRARRRDLSGHVSLPRLEDRRDHGQGPLPPGPGRVH